MNYRCRTAGSTARLVGCLVLGILGNGCISDNRPEPEMRFRGDYTHGHEVDTFCPTLTAQCYWLDPQTPATIRDQLSSYSDTAPGSPYAASCLVVAAEVDDESPRTGFAADYDGLIRLEKVYGACEQTALVTQGDVSHRRWVAAFPKRFPAALTPELDFGQRIGSGVFVSGNDGCREFTAVFVLRGTVAEFTELESGPTGCLTEDEKPAFDPGEPFEPMLSPEHRLTLKTANGNVRFDLSDWVR